MVKTIQNYEFYILLHPPILMIVTQMYPAAAVFIDIRSQPRDFVCPNYFARLITWRWLIMVSEHFDRPLHKDE